MASSWKWPGGYMNDLSSSPESKQASAVWEIALRWDACSWLGVGQLDTSWRMNENVEQFNLWPSWDPLL